MQLFHTRRVRERSEITRAAATRANPMVFDEALVYWDGNFNISCAFKMGVSLYVSNRSAWLDTEVYVSKRYEGRGDGLLGNGDGNQTNDFRNRAGVVLYSNLSLSRAIINHMFTCKYNQ